MSSYKNFFKALCALVISFGAVSCSTNSGAYTQVSFPSGIDHSTWDGLLKKYVDEKGLVNYKAWKSDEQDREKLDSYLTSFAQAGSPPAQGAELGAAAVNAYNAFAIRTILRNYPVVSIRKINSAFTKKEHLVGGQTISLDDIEKGNAIPTIGAQAHAIVVCCAKSCPPLQNEAFTDKNLEQLSDEASREWLARKELNEFNQKESTWKISKIFKWYDGDFAKEGGVESFIKTYGPESIPSSPSNISFLPYDWNLNQQP